MARPAPHKWFKKGFVYFIVCDSLGIVKIGMSNRWQAPRSKGGDPTFLQDRRIRELQTACPAPIRIAGMVSANVSGTESDYHRHFKHFKKYREWYWLVGQLKDFVEAIEAYERQHDEAIREWKLGRHSNWPRFEVPKLKDICIPNVAIPTEWQVV